MDHLGTELGIFHNSLKILKAFRFAGILIWHTNQDYIKYIFLLRTYCDVTYITNCDVTYITYYDVTYITNCDVTYITYCNVTLLPIATLPILPIG